MNFVWTIIAGLLEIFNATKRSLPIALFMQLFMQTILKVNKLLKILKIQIFISSLNFKDFYPSKFGWYYT